MDRYRDWSEGWRGDTDRDRDRWREETRSRNHTGRDFRGTPYGSARDFESHERNWRATEEANREYDRNFGYPIGYGPSDDYDRDRDTRNREDWRDTSYLGRNRGTGYRERYDLDRDDDRDRDVSDRMRDTWYRARNEVGDWSDRTFDRDEDRSRYLNDPRNRYASGRLDDDRERYERPDRYSTRNTGRYAGDRDRYTSDRDMRDRYDRDRLPEREARDYWDDYPWSRGRGW